MSTLELLLYGQLGASLVMALAWVHALLIKNTSYVDVLWGYGVGVLGFIYLVLADENTDPARMALLKALLLTWSIRAGWQERRDCKSASSLQPDHQHTKRIAERLRFLGNADDVGTDVRMRLCHH